MQERDSYGMFFKSLVVLVAAATGGLAQQGVVSPTGYENRWAATVLDQWGTGLAAPTSRVLQIHTDVPALTIGEVAWRPTALMARWAQTHDFALLLGEGDYANRTPVFSNNFASPPTLAVARRMVSWPASPTPPVMLPGEAFVLRIPLDRPWAYSRARDLVWMLETHDTTYQGWAGVDGAARLRWEDIRYGTVHGTGCYNTWNNELAKLFAEAAASRSLEHRISLWCDGLRPNSATTILLGATAVGQSYPFLCGFQYVDDVFLGLLRVANGSGQIPRVNLLMPYQLGTVGFRVRGQAFCLDDGRHPLLLPVTLTNGVEIELPPVLPAWQPAFWAIGNLSSVVTQSFDSDRAIVTSFR